MKIILAGASLVSGNRGVNALTRGQINLLLDKYGSKLEIVILSYTTRELIVHEIVHNETFIKIKEVPCNNKYMLVSYLKSLSIGNNELLSEIKSADYVLDISEGDSFSDIYGYRRFVQNAFIKLICNRENVDLVIMPQTMGPFKSFWVRAVATKIIKDAHSVFVRDSLSYKYVVEDLKVKRTVVLKPDMAFYMSPSKEISMNQIINSNKMKIGINVSGLLYNGGYTGKNMFGFKANYKRLIDMLIKEFSKISNSEIILIPHVMVENNPIEDDYAVCKMIASQMEKENGIKVYTINQFYKEDEIKSIISGCEFFIGSRMHSCIAAISTFVPTVPIAYSRKFLGIWKDMGLGDCVVDPKINTEEEIIEEIFTLYNKKNTIYEKLLIEIPDQKQKIAEITNIMR